MFCDSSEKSGKQFLILIYILVVHTNIQLVLVTRCKGYKIFFQNDNLKKNDTLKNSTDINFERINFCPILWQFTEMCDFALHKNKNKTSQV